MNKLLDGLPPDQKFEIAVDAMVSVTKRAVITQRRLDELIERFEEALKRFEQETWAQVIRRELDRRDKMDLTKGKEKHLWRRQKR